MAYMAYIVKNKGAFDFLIFWIHMWAVFYFEW